MDFLYFLESIRNPVLDAFFSLVTHLGEETFFLALAIFVFWCVNKREGYYILIVGLVGTVINQVMKLAFRIPRPWVKDPSFTIVESARAEATGYSFPSGHTQNVAGTFGSIARFSGRRIVRIISITLIVLVALSRMYLGVHTPLDVCVSLAIAAALTILLYPLFKTEERFRCYMPYVVVASVVLSLGLLLYTLFIPTEGINVYNLESGMKNAFTLFGCTAGLVAVYAIDTRYTDFDTRAPWYAQIVKLALGLAIVLLLKSGLSSPLTALFGSEYIARSVRYFLIVLFTGCVWPLTFKYFANWRVLWLESFTEKVRAKFTKK